MRIIAGKWKGLEIKAPSVGTRPSTDRTRQALFSILQHVVEGAYILDLFSGSGALALEALSRGGKRAVAVESDAAASRTIQQNARTLGGAPVQVVQEDALLFLERQSKIRKDGQAFSLLFADPPYEREFLTSALYQVISHKGLPAIVSPDAILVCESPRKLSEEDLAALPPHWLRLSQRKYGKCFITIFQFQQPD